MTFLSYEMTAKQYDKFCEAAAENRAYVKLHDVGFFILKDVRMIVPVVEKEIEENKGTDPDFTVEEAAYMDAMRVAQELAEQDDSEDVDYGGGGMI
jgi:hypothetical protein